MAGESRGKRASTACSAVRGLFGSMKICPCELLELAIYVNERGGSGGAYFVAVVGNENSDVFVEAALREEVLRQIWDVVSVYIGPGASAGQGERDDEVFVGFDQRLCGGCADTRHTLAGACSNVLVRNLTEYGSTYIRPPPRTL